MKKSIRTSVLALAATAALHAHAAPTLVESVQGYTLQNDRVTQFSGLVFDQGKVLATGDAAALRAKYPDAKRVDGQGKTLLPGLIDAHGHVFRLGFKTTEISLSGTKDLPEAQGIIRAYGQKNPQRKWLLGYGWNQVNWKLGRFPTAAELDAAVSDRPARHQRHEHGGRPHRPRPYQGRVRMADVPETRHRDRRRIGLPRGIGQPVLRSARRGDAHRP